MYEKRINYVCIYLIGVKILQKFDFGEIKCGSISDVISEFIMLSEILPHLISPNKSTFCKIFTQIKYTNIVYSLLMLQMLVSQTDVSLHRCFSTIF